VIKFEIGWIKLLEQKAWVFCSLAIFAGTLRYLLGRGLLPFLAKFTWLADTVLLAAAFFGTLTLGSIVHQGGSWAVEEMRNRKVRQAVLARLGSLSEIEHRILSYLVQANNQSFNYRIDDGDVQLLVQKGLLRMAGGHQNVFAVPFCIPDFVWSELRRRSDEFSSAAPPEEEPWVKNWMAY